MRYAPKTMEIITSLSFNPSLAWFVAFLSVTLFLLVFLLIVICLLVYVIRHLHKKLIRNPADDIVFGFSNKHAALSEGFLSRSSHGPSAASLMDPWNTASKPLQLETSPACDCHWLHRAEFERRRCGLRCSEVQFHTYPKIHASGGEKEPSVWSVGLPKRFFSQPTNFRSFQRNTSIKQRSPVVKTALPKNKRVERLLREAEQGEVNLNWPK